MINLNFPLFEIAMNNIWQSMAVLAVVFLVFKIIKNTSAEERSWSWSVAFFAVALLPLAAFLPGEGIDLASSEVAPIQVGDAGAIKIDNAVTKPKLSELPLEKVTLPAYSKSKLLKILLSIWIIGIGISFMKIARAFYNTCQIRSNAYPYAMDENLGREWPDNVEMALCDQINGPMVVGFFKPIIVMPRSFGFELMNEQLKPLLFHELAHINRYDNFFYLFERIILAFYWWNPVMHYIVACLAEERELACDDRAAIKCGDQILFAKSLVSGAKQLIGQNKNVLALAALRRESVLSKRIKRMTSNSFLKEFNMTRFFKTLASLFICVAVFGMMTPRFNESIAQEANETKKSEKIEKKLKSKVLDKEQIAKIRADVEKGLENLPTEEQIAEMERNIREAIENLPTEEMLVEMRKGIKEGLANLPEHIEKEINVDEIIAEAEAGFNEMEIDIDFDEIRAEMEKSLAELPDQKEIEQMRENLERSLEGVMTEEEVEEMRRELQETLDQLPSGDET